MTFAAIFAILIGISMIGYWAVFLTKGLIPEVETEPIRISLHIAVEIITAITLIISGIGLLTDSDWAQDFYLFAMGMLVCTLIVSPGYFAQNRIQMILLLVIISAAIGGLFSILLTLWKGITYGIASVCGYWFGLYIREKHSE